ncbi:MAG: hypothetical protein JNN07_20375 [Verrucomicrobiales bacterium]|nr:hypothetical protein [Verrucomicrobiales bacterium]
MRPTLIALIIQAMLLSGLDVVWAQSKAPLPGTFRVTPAATGTQWIRASIPLGPQVLTNPASLRLHDGQSQMTPAVRPLTWHHGEGPSIQGIRRALVTFLYDFRTLDPVDFRLQTEAASEPRIGSFPLRLGFEGDRLLARGSNGPLWSARLLAPPRTASTPPRAELVESNQCFLWTRFHFADPDWPRIVEIRQDSMGGLVVVAHLQRNQPTNGWAPTLGWEILLTANQAQWVASPGSPSSASGPAIHSYEQGAGGRLVFGEDSAQLYHPTAPFQRRGWSEWTRVEDLSWRYRYYRSRVEEKIPMQPMSWRRAEFVITPRGVAPLTPALEPPHAITFAIPDWQRLHAFAETPDLSAYPRLLELLEYHRLAMSRSAAMGDDWGNVTGYSDGSTQAGNFGMNRLNHCPPLFEEGWRSADGRLRQVGLLWCDNFYDLSIWWGAKARGGTRYNNIRAQNQSPPDDDQAFMWRSNSSVNFCTKGYDSFYLAYEESGDPRMLEALQAQLGYAEEHLHVDRGECRNIGDARDFVRLYRWTGERKHLNEALRLFRQLRTKLSTGDLFDQGGKPLTAEPPFIEDDAAGLKVGYAKPYIIGYALAGLPELAGFVPMEPKLREVIVAVADFMAASQDPVGGWRYPHPRSSHVIMGQAIEHAWQLVQADRYLGPQASHLDAIERVLRQRIQGWLLTGKLFAGLTGWELATGKVKVQQEINALYPHPEDRDFRRDYTEGRADWGSSPPEGLVYFPEVLAFYLKHRPASRLMEAPKPDEPLGQVLSRVKVR